MATRRSQWVLEVSTPQYCPLDNQSCAPRHDVACWLHATAAQSAPLPAVCNFAWLHGPQLSEVHSTTLQTCLPRADVAACAVGSSAQLLLTEPTGATAWWFIPPCLSLLVNGHDSTAEDSSHALSCCTCSVPFLRGMLMQRVPQPCPQHVTFSAQHNLSSAAHCMLRCFFVNQSLVYYFNERLKLFVTCVLHQTS